jgi:D-alanyl-D-alanine carboxypeptidase
MATLASATIRDFPQFYPWNSQKEFTYHGIKQHNRNKLNQGSIQWLVEIVYIVRVAG